MRTLIVASLMALTGCGSFGSPSERAQAAAMGLDRVYAELGAVHATLDHVDRRHFAYSAGGLCLDPDLQTWRELSQETRNAVEEACRLLLEERPEIYLLRGQS